MNKLFRFAVLETDSLTIQFKQFKIENKNRPDYDSKLRKLFFFIRREGLFKTIRKVQSKKIDRYNNNIYATFLLINKAGKNYLNLSLQYHNNIDDFIIDNSFYETELKLDSINYDYDLQDFNQYTAQCYNKFIKNNAASIQLDIRKEKHTNEYKNGVYVYGLGDYSRVYIAPHITNIPKLCCIDYNSLLSRYYKNTYKFVAHGLTAEESYPMIRQTQKPLAIIATYHSDHARIAKELFDINPETYIFIEKPPCVTFDDLNTLIELYKNKAHLEIGFNRRFIPQNINIKSLLVGKKAIVTISVKEVRINKNHWYLWKNQGTRITGNLVHWIDLAIFWVDSLPVEINLMTDRTENDTLAMSVLFENGSIVNITVSDDGNSLRGVQENLEIRFDNETINITDYLSVIHIKNNGAKSLYRSFFRDKGHDAMYNALVNNYNNNVNGQYTVEDLIKSTYLTNKASEMFLSGCRNHKINNEIINILEKLS